MRFRRLVKQLPTRLHFGAFGALGCLAAAVALELVFAQSGMSKRLDEHAIRGILFRNNPADRSTPEALKTGDIQLTLRWHNHNDLDLWCVDPYGEKVWYKNARSRTWGQLDIDMNAEPPFTESPVENVFWPFETAPAGRYEVFVDYFARHGDDDPTPFTVRTLVKGHESSYSGELTRGDAPRLVAAINMPTGPWSLFGIRGGAWFGALVTGAWLALAAGLLTCTLIEAQNHWFTSNHKPPLRAPREMALESLRAAGMGLAVGIGVQLVYGAVSEHWPVLVPAWRLIGWALFGALAAGLLSRRIPNVTGLAATVAGTLAGCAGAVLLNTTALGATESPARLLAAVIFGFAVGVLIFLAEVVVPQPALVSAPEAEPAFVLQLMRLRPYHMSAGRIVRMKDEG